MGFIDKYPYTDFHELNLDWVLNKVKDCEQKVDDFIAFNMITWSGTWDASKSYLKWSVVKDENDNYYLAIKPVPSNVPLTNENYWMNVAKYEGVQKLLIPVTQFGAVGDGVTENTYSFKLAYEFAEKNKGIVFIPYGIFKIDSITATTPTLIDGIIDGNITFNKEVISSQKKIFTDESNIVFATGQTVVPEWFGAVADGKTDSTLAFQKALNSVHNGCLFLAGGHHNIYTLPNPTEYYKLLETLEVKNDNVNITSSSSAVIVSSADIAFYVHGGSVTDGNLVYNNNFRMSNINIYYDGTNKSTSESSENFCGIKLTGCLRYIIDTVEINNYGCGIYTKNSINSFIKNIFFNSPESGEGVCGVYLNDNLDGALFANASLKIINSTFTLNTESSFGIRAIGSTTSDILVSGCETSHGYSGITIENVEHNGELRLNLDVHIEDNIFDNPSYSGISIINNSCEKSSVSIKGNWVASSGSVSYGITASNLYNSIITNNTICGLNSSVNSNGINLNGCYGISIVANAISYYYSAIVFSTSGGNCSVTSNVIDTRSDNGKSYGDAIIIPSTLNAINVSNNSFFYSNTINAVSAASGGNVINYNMSGGLTYNLASGNVHDGVTV